MIFNNENIITIAQNAGWEVFYEEESDSLYWTILPVPKKDALVKVSREIYFYVGAGGIIHGLMIQPFKNNFLTHHRSVVTVASLITEKQNEGVFTIPEGKKELARDYMVSFSESIKMDIYADALDAKVNVEDLAGLLEMTT